MFQAVLADADAEGRIDWSMVSWDSTSCQAHRHAAGAPGTTPRIPRRRAIPRQHRPDGGLRRSRGGLTRKIHLAEEGGPRPVALHRVSVSGAATLSWSGGEVAANGGAVGAGVDTDEVGELVDE